MDVDLSDVAFPPGTTHVTATVGIGHLRGGAAPGPRCERDGPRRHRVTSRCSAPDDGGFGTSRTMSQPAVTGATPKVHIVLDAQTGVGQVQVMRDGP